MSNVNGCSISLVSVSSCKTFMTAGTLKRDALIK